MVILISRCICCKYFHQFYLCWLVSTFQISSIHSIIFLWQVKLFFQYYLRSNVLLACMKSFDDSVLRLHTLLFGFRWHVLACKVIVKPGVCTSLLLWKLNVFSNYSLLSMYNTWNLLNKMNGGLVWYICPYWGCVIKTIALENNGGDGIMDWKKIWMLSWWKEYINISTKYLLNFERLFKQCAVMLF